MSHYSPYNKTYRYILFQNQAYHIKNKRNASPEVRTNLRHSMSRISPIKDPENNFEVIIQSSRPICTDRQIVNPQQEPTSVIMSSFAIIRSKMSSLINLPNSFIRTKASKSLLKKGSINLIMN